MPHVNGLVAYSDASHAPGEGVAAVAAVVRGPEGLEARAQVLLAARGSTEAERAACLLAGRLALLAAGLAGHAPVPLVVFVDHEQLARGPALNGEGVTVVWLRRRSDVTSRQVDSAARALLRGQARPLVSVYAAGVRLLWASGPQATAIVSELAPQEGHQQNGQS